MLEVNLKNVDDKSLLEFIKPSISKDEIVSLFDEAIYLDKVNDKDNHKYNDRYTLSTQKKKEKEKKDYIGRLCRSNYCRNRTWVVFRLSVPAQFL